MKKLINITGFSTIGLLLIAIIVFTIGVLWNAANESLLHSLFRYSFTGTVILWSIWTMLFTYNEFKEG
jgi:hypothetical protein